MTLFLTALALVAVVFAGVMAKRLWAAAGRTYLGIWWR
jgi:hypothetical protein